MNRISGSVAASLAVAAVVALLEAAWARAASTQPLNLVRAWLVSFGLLTPVALAVALGVVVVLLVSFGPVGFERRTGEGVRTRAVRVAPFAPLLGLSTSVLAALVAHLDLALSATDLAPWPAAATLTLATALLARVLLGAALVVSRSESVLRWTTRLGPGALLLLGIVGCAAPVGFGALSGTPNGDGGFWAIFGVLRRQELDLRATFELSALTAGAVLGGLLGASRQRVLGLVATALGLAAFIATGARLLDDATLGLGLERGAALSRSSLRLLRSVTDADGDGASRWFGGNDCDDARDDVYPGAIDRADNGLDEDCSGADSAPTAREPEPPVSRAEPSQAGAPTSLAPSSDASGLIPKDLNVILITIDTLRYDLGYTGYTRPISAHLDRLAARSVVFDRAYSLASYTGKSIGPLLIGRYPSETDRGWLHFNRFGPAETFVQQRLQAAGVRTVGVHGHWYFTPEYGPGRGFDVLDTSATPAKRQIEGDKTVNGDKLSDAVIARLSDPENTRGRFFLWAHYLDPHADYIRHEGFDFGPRGRDLYDSEVAFTDQQIGRVLDFVASSAFEKNTAIIVTSDHGEAFGEHGMYRHGFEVWEALVRVPLIVYVPGVAPSHLGVRRSAIDLAPTLLELMGVPLPTDDDRLSGESLVPDLVLPAGQVPEPRPVFIDMSAGPYNEERQALIDNDLKLIMCTGRGALGLYDLSVDPNEAIDKLGDKVLAKGARERFAAFRSQLRLIRVKPE